MVLFVVKWHIHSDKAGEYAKWAQTVIQRTLAARRVNSSRVQGISPCYRRLPGGHNL